MKIAITFVLLATLLVMGCTQQQTTTTAQTTTPTTIEGQPTTIETTTQTTAPGTTQTTEPSAGGQEIIVEMTSSGFNPQTVTINKGDTVTWVNLGTENHWPASAMHPTHTVYPGSDIQKCGTAEESNIFDACTALGPEETYSFTFNEVGEWNYHDHLQASLFGKVIVQG